MSQFHQNDKNYESSDNHSQMSSNNDESILSSSEDSEEMEEIRALSESLKKESKLIGKLSKERDSEDEESNENSDLDMDEFEYDTGNSKLHGSSKLNKIISQSEDEDVSENSDSEDEMNDIENESKEDKPAFTIICRVDSDDDEDYNEMMIRKAEKEEEKRKKQLKTDENAKWIAKKTDLDEIAQNLPRSATGVRIVKPFSYDIMKQKQKAMGVIYVEKPPAKELQNKKALRTHLETYGIVTRIETDIILKGKKKIICGYYVEFSSKDVAMRVAETLNGAPISRKDSRFLIIRFLDKFNWNQIQDENTKRQMLRKLMRSQATNELRAIQTYEKRKKLSSALKKQNKLDKNKKFIFAQKKFKDYVSKESNLHIDFMPILGQKSS